MNKQAKIKKVMEEFKNGTLKTPDGKIVKNRKQALAIAMSESEDYTEKSLMSQINIGSVSEAEDIIKAAGSEELFEKAQPGDEREYQGRMYVYGTTKSGKMGWKVKEKVKRGQGTTTSSTGGSSTTQKKTTAESRKIYNTILGINNTGTTVRETSDAFEVKFDPNDFKTHGKVSQAVSQIVRYYRQTNSVDIDEKNNKIVIRKKQTKSSNSVVHDINGTKVIVTQNRDGSYTLEANGKKVRSDDPSFFIRGTNIKPRVKTVLAKKVGLDTAVTKKKLRPIGTGTNGPERRRSSTATSKAKSNSYYIKLSKDLETAKKELIGKKIRYNEDPEWQKVVQHKSKGDGQTFEIKDVVEGNVRGHKTIMIKTDVGIFPVKNINSDKFDHASKISISE